MLLDCFSITTFQTFGILTLKHYKKFLCTLILGSFWIVTLLTFRILKYNFYKTFRVRFYEPFFWIVNLLTLPILPLKYYKSLRVRSYEPLFELLFPNIWNCPAEILWTVPGKFLLDSFWNIIYEHFEFSRLNIMNHFVYVHISHFLNYYFPNILSTLAEI